MSTSGRPEGELRSAPRDGTPARARIEPIRGGYIWIEVEGIEYRVYFEEAGSGIPLLCLHTAGADCRQYRHVLNDPDITSRFRVVAFDMPWHGKSNPPDKYWLIEYKLTMALYVATIRAMAAALGMERPVVMGCSMGGYIVLKLAHDHPRELRGVVSLEGAAKSAGRFNEFLHHPAIHGSEFVASYTSGLNSPTSPEAGPRECFWYYAQGGPGVYAGDTYFARAEFDMTEQVKEIDTSLCPVSVLTAEYDYSALPEMTKYVADSIKGSSFTFMKGMGHFPIIENYPAFRPYLHKELARWQR